MAGATAGRKRERWTGRKWLSGPILGKELRVSARHRRTYVIRLVYGLLLTLFVGLFWNAFMSGFETSASQLTFMAEMGKALIGMIVWFQFLALQVVAVAMLSTSISDEVYKRTLGVLMTTPIRAAQIVLGKLTSKLLQLGILLAMSVPLLAVVRVFGGVSWQYLVAGTCITATAVLFAGSLSLFYSIRTRAAYAVILRSLVSLFLLYGAVPLVTVLGLFLIKDGWGATEAIITGLAYVNPFVAMQLISIEQVGATSGPAAWYWPVHCLTMLALSAGLLAWTTRIVRRVALRVALGEDLSRRRRRKKQAPATPPPPPPAGGGAPPSPPRAAADTNITAGSIRRVKGRPIVWKELRTPLVETRGKTVVGTIIALLVLGGTYLVCLGHDILDEDFVHVVYVNLFVGVGLLFSGVMSATTISSEREAGTWEALLATPLTATQLLWGKAVGVFRRCLPIWGLLAAHVLVFSVAGLIHPVAILHLALLVAWVVCFFAGSGLVFSIRLKRTTTAVVANIALGAVLWWLVPMVTGILAMGAVDAIELILVANPFVQATVITAGAVGEANATSALRQLEYSWPTMWTGGHTAGWAGSTVMLAIVGMVYAVVGGLFFLSARNALRRSRA